MVLDRLGGGLREVVAPERLGDSVDRYKILVFVLSAFLAGVAGGVYAIGHGFASLQEVYWTTSGKVVVMTVLGGMGTLWGAVVGAGIIVQLEDYLATAGIDANGIVTGAIFAITVLLFRKGIWGTVAQLLGRRRRDDRDAEPGPVRPATTTEEHADAR